MLSFFKFTSSTFLTYNYSVYYTENKKEESNVMRFYI